MTNFEKIKQMSVENMAEMLLDASENHFTYCNHCSHQSFYAPHRQVLLSDIARDDENEPNDRIKAVDTLNKMTGEYTVKVDAKVEQSEKLSDVFRQLGGEGLSE